MAVYRCYVTKKPGFDSERNALFRDLSELLSLNSLESVDIFNRYDVEGVSPETFEQAKRSVFAEPQCDDCYPEALPAGALSGPHRVLAVESLPGQYDQRADSCAACIQLLTGGERPRAAYAHVYILHGSVVHYRAVRILWESGDYCIVQLSPEEEPPEGYTWLARNDIVITKGRGLREGRVLS